MQAIAASPEGAVNGYAIGSYLYLGIVYAFPIGLGLGGLALDLPVSHLSPLQFPTAISLGKHSMHCIQDICQPGNSCFVLLQPDLPAFLI